MAAANRVTARTFDNNMSGAMFKYGPQGMRGTFEIGGLKCDVAYTAGDGAGSVALAGDKGLVAAFRLRTLPLVGAPPVKFTMVDTAGEKHDMVAFAARNADHPYFVQLKPDRVVVEHPAGVEALLAKL